MTLPLLAAAWLLGIAASAIWGAPPWAAGAWFAAFAPAGWAWKGRDGALLPLAAALLALLGAWRFAGWAETPAPNLARFLGADVTIEGRIDSEPDPGLTTVRYHVRADHILGANGRKRETAGRALITLRQGAAYELGAPVRISGALEEPPVLEAFDYRAFLARRGVAGTMSFPRVETLDAGTPRTIETVASRVRLRLERALQASLPEPTASLAAGIVMGRDAAMPRELTESFRETGLAHFVAVSGSNVALAAALAFVLFTPLVGRTRAIVPAALSILAYTFLAGAEETVVRAAIMAAIVLAGYWLGRPQSGIATLGAAAILMTAAQPGLAVEPGFQLSVASTAGLMAFSPWIRHGLAALAARLGLAQVVPAVLLDVAALSLAAWIAALPIIWAVFGQVSLIGPLVNVPTVPVFALAFWASAAAALAGVVWEPAGWIAGAAAWYPLGFIVWMAEAGASVPHAAIALPRFGPGAALAASLALAAAAWPAYRHLPPDRPFPGRFALAEIPPHAARIVRLTVIGGGTGALAAAIAVLSLTPIGGPGRLEVAILDVGQGDAILVTTPHGQRVLVDGGPSGLVLARQLGKVLPHWAHALHAVALTHPDTDHAGGLPDTLERFRAGTVYDSGARSGTATFARFAEQAGGRERLRRGDAFEVDGVRFEVLWPPPGDLPDGTNAGSLALLVRYGETRILLPGDIERTAQHDLLALGAPVADALLAPHHGADTNERGFLDATEAALAVISVGEDNPHGHPARETLAALAGRAVLRTDLHGRVVILSDGESLRVRADRFAPAEGGR